MFSGGCAMRTWIRPLVSTLLVGALLMGAASCSNDDSLTGPSAPQPSAALAPAPGVDVVSLASPTLQAALGALQLLTCSPQPYAVTTAVVGPAGGVLKVGAHQLAIPPGALSAQVTITAEQVSGSVNSVRFSPQGLRFARPATLTLSYANCLPNPLPKRVVYTDEQLDILELIRSLNAPWGTSVTGFISHFSRYAVAY